MANALVTLNGRQSVVISGAALAAQYAAAAAGSLDAVNDISGATLTAAASQGTYASTSAGLSATSNGQYFYALSGTAPNKRSRLYLNNAGSAVEQAEVVTPPLLASGTGGSLVSYAFAFTGATTRTVTDKLQEMVSVKDFGAVGNDIADDTAEIQAALNSGADHIWFPDGTYRISDALTIPSGTTLEGPGATAVVKQVGTNKRIFVIDTRTDITIRGLKLENNLTGAGNLTVAGANGGDGVVIRNSSRVKVEGCTIDKIGTTSFTGNCCGVSIYYSTDITVDGNIFTGAGQSRDGADVEFMYSSRRVIVTNNLSTSENNSFVIGPSVSAATGDTSYHVISNNIAARSNATTARSGIIASYASTPAEAIISNNIIENFPSNGIYISAATVGTGDTAGVLIGGNIIRFCGGSGLPDMSGIESGIYLSGRAGITCVGNRVSYAGYQANGTVRSAAIAGILISGAARAITVSGNTVTSGNGPGINVRSGVVQTQQGITITGNTLQANLGSAFYYDQTIVGAVSQDVTFANNTIVGEAVDAHGIDVRVFNGAAVPVRLKIHGNNVTGKTTGSTMSGLFTNCATLPGWSVQNNNFSLWANGVQFTNNSLPDKEIGLVCPVDNNIFTGNTTAINVPNTAGYSICCGNVFVSNTANASPAGLVLIGSRIGARTFRATRATVPPGQTWEVGQQIDFTAPAVGGRTGAICTVAGTPGTWVETGQLHHTNSKTQDWPSLTTGTQSTTTVTLANAQLGDFVEVSMNLDLQGMNLWGYVSSAGIVTAVLRNDTGSTIDLASGTLRARLVKQ